MNTYNQSIVNACHEVNNRLDFYENSTLINVKPSSEGFSESDDKIISLFIGDLKNDLMLRFIYRDLLQRIIKELHHELSSLHYGINSDGVIQDAEILLAAIKLARCHNRKSME